MLRFNLMARKATKLSALLLISANCAFAQTSTLTNNATAAIIPPVPPSTLSTSRDWSVLQTDVTPNSYGAPVISRTTGTTTSACLDNTGNIQSPGTFTAAIPGLTNPVFTWSTVGGINIVGATTGASVTVKPLQDASGKYFPGKLILNYTGSTSATTVVPYTFVDCNNVTKSGTTNYTVVTPQKGQAYVNLVQKFTHNFPIVGPVCLAVGDNVTFSVAPLVSNYEARDGYKWEQLTPQGALGLNVPTVSTYNSLDNSSITGTVAGPVTSLSVYVGACNQAASDKKTLLFGTKMPVTSATAVVKVNNVVQTVKNPCIDAGISQVTLTVQNVDPLVDYLWSWDNSSYSLATGTYTSTTIVLNIGGTSGNVFLKATPKTQANVPVGQTAYCTVNNTPSFDQITLNRGFTSATVTGVNGTAGTTCVQVGQVYQYSATTNNVAIGAAVNWTLPAGMVFEPASPVQTSSTISVRINSGIADGSQISGTISAAPGICAGNITGLFNLKTAPNFTAVTGPNLSSTPNVYCAAPSSSNIIYTAKAPVTASNPTGVAQFYDYIAWTPAGGITGGGSATFGASFPANFVSGTITGVAVKSGCPNSAPVTITVKSSANTGILASVVANKTCLNKDIADQVTLTTDAGFASYNWSVPTGWTVTSPTIAPTNATSATTSVNSITYNTNGVTANVSVTGKNECSTTTPKTITLTASGVGQVVTITKSSVSGADILGAPFINGATYEWYKNGTLIPLATGFTLQLTVASGVTNTYYVVITLNSCKSQSTGTVATSTYSNARMAMDEIASAESADLSVSPNPSSTGFTLSLKGLTNAEIGIVQQTSGVEVKHYNSVGNTLTVPTSGWAAGVYVVTATSGLNKVVKSVIVLQ